MLQCVRVDLREEDRQGPVRILKIRTGSSNVAAVCARGLFRIFKIRTGPSTCIFSLCSTHLASCGILRSSNVRPRSILRNDEEISQHVYVHVHVTLVA